MPTAHVGVTAGSIVQKAFSFVLSVFVRVTVKTPGLVGVPAQTPALKRTPEGSPEAAVTPSSSRSTGTPTGSVHDASAGRTRKPRT